MAIGKRGEGAGSPTKWLELDGKAGTLVAWDKAAQAEETFSFVAGKVTDVRLKEKSYGTKVGHVVNITLKDPDSGERYIVQCGAGSRVTTRLLGQLNAADLANPVYIAPYLMKEGDALQDGTAVKQDTVMTSVKAVLGVDGDKLNLSEGIKPFYGEGIDKLPAPVPLTKPDGSPIMQQGQQLMDRSAIEALCADLVDAVDAKVKGPGQAQGHGDGVDTDAALAAAGNADRGAMRARG